MYDDPLRTLLAFQPFCIVLQVLCLLYVWAVMSTQCYSFIGYISELSVREKLGSDWPTATITSMTSIYITADRQRFNGDLYCLGFVSRNHVGSSLQFLVLILFRKYGIHMKFPTFEIVHLSWTTHPDTIIRATMVTSITSEDVRDISNSAITIFVILTRARHPTVVIQDMNLSFNVIETEETSRNNWYDIIPTDIS